MYQTLPIDPHTPLPDIETPVASPQTLWAGCQPSIQTQGFPVIYDIDIPIIDSFQLRDLLSICSQLIMAGPLIEI